MDEIWEFLKFSQVEKVRRFEKRQLIESWIKDELMGIVVNINKKI
jgi:hypothetical protein